MTPEIDDEVVVFARAPISKAEAAILTTPHFDPEALRARVVRDAFGFVSKPEVEALAAHPVSRLWPLLVRCGGSRFVAAAQDVATLIAAVEASGDYVRDVSFPFQGAGGQS
jgi:hypothetical protein